MNKWISKDTFFLIGILLLSFLFDFSNAFRRTYFGDFDEFLSVRGAYYVEPIEQGEFISSWFTHTEFNKQTLDVTQVTPENGNASGYLWILKYWMRWFGCSDFAVRMLSVSFHLLFVIMTWFFCRSLFTRRTLRWVCVAGMALNPVIVHTAFMIRGYSLSALLALSATYLLLRFLKNQKWHLLITYAVVMVYAFTVHYLSSVMLAAHFAFVMCMKDNQVLKKKLYSVLGITLVLVGAFFMMQSRGVSNFMKVTTASVETKDKEKDKSEKIITARKIKETTLNSLGYSSIQYFMKYFYGMPSLYALSLFMGVSYISVYALIPSVLLVLLLWLLVLKRYVKKQLGDISVLFSILSISGFLMCVVLAVVFGHILTLASIKYSVFTAAYFFPLLLIMLTENRIESKWEKFLLRIIFSIITVFILIPFLNLPQKLVAANTPEQQTEFSGQSELTEFGKVSATMFHEHDTLVFTNPKTLIAYQFCVPPPESVMRVERSLSGNAVYLMKNDSLVLLNTFPHKTAY